MYYCEYYKVLLPFLGLKNESSVHKNCFVVVIRVLKYMPF